MGMEMDSSEEDALDFNQCQRAVKRLTEYLSHELQPIDEEAVHHHLLQCRGCFTKFHFEETLLQTIRTRVEQVQAPLALRERLLRAIDAADDRHKELNQ